jgi:hypothetical protein
MLWKCGTFQGCLSKAVLKVAFLVDWTSSLVLWAEGIIRVSIRRVQVDKKP